MKRTFQPSTTHRKKTHGFRVRMKTASGRAVIHVAAGRGPASRLGIALTRRLVPRAVDRNRLKRMTREAFRRHSVKNLGLDCVVALRGSFDTANAAPTLEEILGLFDQLAARARAE